MEKAFIDMQMVLFIKVNSKIINIMDKENINFPMLQSIKDNGKMG